MSDFLLPLFDSFSAATFFSTHWIPLASAAVWFLPSWGIGIVACRSSIEAQAPPSKASRFGLYVTLGAFLLGLAGAFFFIWQMTPWWPWAAAAASGLLLLAVAFFSFK